MTASGRRALSLAAVFGCFALLFGTPEPGRGQEVDGRLWGAVTMGTAGAVLDESALQVRVLVLEGDTVAAAVAAEVRNGQYQARVPAILTRTYVAVITYRGILYFVPPAILAPSAPEVQHDITVYETTSERPALTIESTAVTLIGIERDLGHMAFIREDLVVNPTDRVYTGDGRGVTFRIPAPEGTLEASGENADGEFALEAGAVSTTVPIQAAGTTSIVTRYLVAYDPAADGYLLRVTTPVAARHIEVRVPQGFLRGLDPQAPARTGADMAIGAGPTASVLQVIEQGETSPGQSLLVRLEGIAPGQNVNALTERSGALIAVFGTLALLGAAVAVAARRRAEAT